MIAKLVNGNLQPCPRHGVDALGRVHTNLCHYYEMNPGFAAKDGYYPVRHTDKPDGDYLPAWEMQGCEIVQIWTPYTPEPEPADPVAERLEMIEECLLEMSEIIYA